LLVLLLSAMLFPQSLVVPGWWQVLIHV